MYKYRDVGVHNYYGPDWEENLATICDEFSEFTCDYEGPNIDSDGDPEPLDQAVSVKA